eukprot:66983-Chlamydomonas_euryale.AAC.2
MRPFFINKDAPFLHQQRRGSSSSTQSTGCTVRQLCQHFFLQRPVLACSGKHPSSVASPTTPPMKPVAS